MYLDLAAEEQRDRDPSVGLIVGGGKADHVASVTEGLPDRMVIVEAERRREAGHTVGPRDWIDTRVPKQISQCVRGGMSGLPPCTERLPEPSECCGGIAVTFSRATLPAVVAVEGRRGSGSTHPSSVEGGPSCLRPAASCRAEHCTGEALVEL
jgi:hypothetical protein